MAKQKKASQAQSPVERVQRYLEAHHELKDLRWYTLLLFNAFEETMQMYLSWRLSWREAELPPGVRNNSNLLFDLVMGDAKQLRERARMFAEARNQVAHRFQDLIYAEKIQAFAEAASNSKEGWPGDPEKQLVFLAQAVSWLSIEVGFHMQDVTPRPDAPFPHLPHEISFAAEYPEQAESAKPEKIDD